VNRSGVGARRSEIVSAVAVFAFWPRGGEAQGSRSEPTAPQAVAVSDVELAAPRATAGLAPCPSSSGAPSSGPLAGVTVPCLGATGAVDLGAALGGRPALLNVWASWCRPCRDELPALAEYAARPDAVPVLGVDVQDDPRAALALLAELGVRLPSVVDSSDAVRAALDVPPALPVSYVVRSDGTVVRVDPPTPFRSADAVADAVARLS
jgi:thiol-disulfide isomerase/thioredoxin